MDFKSTVDIIIKDINELKDIVDDLKSYPGVPPIQIEIAKSKCRNAVEILELLKNIPLEVSVKESEIKKVTETEKLPADVNRAKTSTENNSKIADDIVPTTSIVNTNDSKETNIESVTVTSVNESKRDSDVKTDTTSGITLKETKIEEKVETKKITEELIETFEKEDYFDIEEETDVPEVPQAQKIEQIREERKKEKSGTLIFAERFTSNPNSVYDRLSGAKQTDSSKGKRSSNLFEIIGLNDKYLFIREIFNGDVTLYNLAINRLNSANTFTEAHKIILEYVDDEKDEAYNTLVELIKRKFTVNG